MSISSRNRRAAIYPYSSTNDGGYVTSVYGPPRGTFFCRFSPIRGTETTQAGQAAHRESAVFEFAESTPVGVNDLIVLDGVQWKVSAFTVRRTMSQRCTIVDVFRNDEEPAVGLVA